MINRPHRFDVASADILATSVAAGCCKQTEDALATAINERDEARNGIARAPVTMTIPAMMMTRLMVAMTTIQHPRVAAATMAEAAEAVGSFLRVKLAGKAI